MEGKTSYQFTEVRATGLGQCINKIIIVFNSSQDIEKVHFDRASFNEEAIQFLHHVHFHLLKHVVFIDIVQVEGPAVNPSGFS